MQMDVTCHSLRVLALTSCRKAFPTACTSCCRVWHCAGSVASCVAPSGDVKTAVNFDIVTCCFVGQQHLVSALLEPAVGVCCCFTGNVLPGPSCTSKHQPHQEANSGRLHSVGMYSIACMLMAPITVATCCAACCPDSAAVVAQNALNSLIDEKFKSLCHKTGSLRCRTMRPSMPLGI